jgi:hypothetical protein
MKFVINPICTLLLGWPAMFVGYLYAALLSGFKNGVFFYERHQDECLDKFARNRKG